MLQNATFDPGRAAAFPDAVQRSRNRAGESALIAMSTRDRVLGSCSNVRSEPSWTSRSAVTGSPPGLLLATRGVVLGPRPNLTL